MTGLHKLEVWGATLLVALVSIGGYFVIRGHKPITIRGAVLVQNADPNKQQPIAGVTVSAGDFALADTTTDSSGSFSLNLHTIIRRGHRIVLSFRSPLYHPLELDDFVSDRLYVVHLVPMAATPTSSNSPQVKVTNVRVRYTVSSMTEVNVGGETKTFEVVNKGNVPCNNKPPCSPNGKWKANAGSATLDAGSGNIFRDTRASCIAGPCPFTRIDGFSPGGQTLKVSALNWSDTATFLVEAEVFRPMMNQMEHWSYPVIFGDGLSFTLPSSAGSVSIEADIDGNTIIFPMGPSLFLSWASCDAASDPQRGQIYQCKPKPGYRFQ